ncbi:MAG: PAS domain S-box protein [Nocardioides sp.]
MSVSGRSASFERRLDPLPASVREARGLTRDLLQDADREDLVDNALLLVTEVVTNALLHAGTSIDLSAVLGEDGLRVVVADGSPHLPVRRRYGPSAGTGRGLMILDQLVDDWGVEQRDFGKAVCFRLFHGARTGAGREVELRRPAGLDVDHDPTAAVTVRLLQMPLLLHSAWREHAEALLRECLLASLDGDGDGDDDGDDDGDGDGEPIQVHAEATDAIAILEEQVPAAEVDLDPERIMSEAVEPHVSAAEVQIFVPLGSVASFATLDRAIGIALEMGADDHALTPPSQPEIQAFRQWVCREVLGQARGAEATPWSFESEAPVATPVESDWAVEDVTSAVTGRIAADQTNRILAVSPAALALLGYDDASELVGQRLVTIVPDRYRQAHIAGFTMYLLVGRQPLLGRPIAVPALRRDGSEVEVLLTVKAHRDERNRRVFLADIESSEA